ncbi:MAG: hypothetical protein XXXJIFNMEKO3_LKCDNKCA_00145 (plasmid) [Candidatus Erwinia impunctatus]
MFVIKSGQKQFAALSHHFGTVESGCIVRNTVTLKPGFLLAHHPDDFFCEITSCRQSLAKE